MIVGAVFGVEAHYTLENGETTIEPAAAGLGLILARDEPNAKLRCRILSPFDDKQIDPAAGKRRKIFGLSTSISLLSVSHRLEVL